MAGDTFRVERRREPGLQDFGLGKHPLVTLEGQAREGKSNVPHQSKVFANFVRSGNLMQE